MKFLPLGLCLLSLTVTACEHMESAAVIATEIGRGAGVITAPQAESIRRTARAVSRSAEEFTPEQEYYLGRSVGAVILGRYRPYVSDPLNRYVNVLGQSLAQASDQPALFGGYHFLVLDSEEINAFATPSGLVFVTKGLLKCCQSEDGLAAVLAHEIGHIQLRHGMQAIEKARVTEALATIALEGTKAFGKRELAALAENFGGAISDIAATLINSGYSRAFEYEADRAAVQIVRRLGYDPNALPEMLAVMAGRLKPGGLDFARTHPPPAERISELKKAGLSFAPVKPIPARQKRFQKALGEIRG